MPTGDTYAVVSDEVGDLATVDRPNTTGVGTCPADPAAAGPIIWQATNFYVHIISTYTHTPV